MDRKRNNRSIEDSDRARKVVKTMKEANASWEWPILDCGGQEMLPYWVYNRAEQQQMPHSAAAPCASWQTRDTLSLGNWAKHQASLELSLGVRQGCGINGSPDCDDNSADVEDTATSSCSESSGGLVQQSPVNCNSHNQQQPGLGSLRTQQAVSGDDDSVTSKQPRSSTSAAFSFGCIPATAAGLEWGWPAVEVGAQ